MIDIHCHILPGIDDGAKDIDTTEKMLRLAADDGVKQIIVTPHYEETRYQPSLVEIEQKLELIRPIAAPLGIEVYPGMEVYLTPDTPNDLKEGRLLTLAGSRYLLVEFPSQQIPPYAERVLFEIMLQGIIPVIAHPERNYEIINHPNRLIKLLDKGALTQVNSWSVLGYFGKEAAQCARVLLHHGLAHFLASDAHSDKSRTPQLAEAVLKINQIASKETVQELKQNAQKILVNEMISSFHRPIKKRRGLTTALWRKINLW